MITIIGVTGQIICLSYQVVRLCSQKSSYNSGLSHFNLMASLLSSSEGP